MDGEVSRPCASGRIRGRPSSMTATATLDVPKSMPMTAPGHASERRLLFSFRLPDLNAWEARTDLNARSAPQSSNVPQRCCRVERHLVVVVPAAADAGPHAG